MMDFVPLRKQSKKKQKEYYSSRRGSWNGINPITRVVPNAKAYDRNRSKHASRQYSNQEE